MKTEGKFKDFDTLLKSYKELEAAFTKKCQELSKLEKEKLSQAAKEVLEKSESPAAVAADDNRAAQQNIASQADSAQEPQTNLRQVTDAGGIDAERLLNQAQAEKSCDNGQTAVSDNDKADLSAEHSDNSASVTGNHNDKNAQKEAETQASVTSPEPAEVEKEIERFFAQNADAEQYAEQIGQNLTSAPDYNSLMAAYNKVLLGELNKARTPDTQTLVDMVAKDPQAVEAVIYKYFEGMIGNMPPVIIKGGLGAPAITPKQKAKNLGDAANLAKLLLQK